jgi:DNA-binding FrmR family transcriptional regulator
MNKLDCRELNNSHYDAKKKHKEKLLDEQKAKQQPVINAIKDLETERHRIHNKSEDIFQALVEVFKDKLDNLDSRGINECATEVDIDKIKIWNDVIVFKMFSSVSTWKAKIQISKDREQPSSNRIFNDHLVWVEYDALCPDAVLDVNAFTKQVQEIDFQVLMDDLNKCVKDSKERASILKTQASSLVKKIERSISNDRDDMMTHLISEVTTNGLTRPSNIRDNRGKIIVTERLNSSDGYYTPWKLKVVDSTARNWRYQQDDTELACEVTFRKSYWKTDGQTYDYFTQHVLIDIPKCEIEKWLRDLFIYQVEKYTTGYGEDYLRDAFEKLKGTPYLNISKPADVGHHNLNNNKKERALRDSFGEWVQEPKTEVVKA